MLDKLFWFLDEHVVWIHILNMIVSVAVLLIPSKVLAIIVLIVMIPLWVLEVISLVYGITKGYFS